MIKFVKNQEAVFIKELSLLIIADLHLGIEKELSQKGILVKPNLIQKLKTIKQKVNPKNLVLIGDIKHQIGIKLTKSFF